MKNLLYAFGMILGGALLLVIVLPFEIIEDPPSPGLRRTSRPDTPDKTNTKKGKGKKC